MTERLGTTNYASTADGLVRHAATLLRVDGSVEITGQLIAACGVNLSRLRADMAGELGQEVTVGQVSGVDAYRFEVA